MNKSLVWINGDIRPEDRANVSPRDHGLIVGDGVFEMMRVISGQAFALGRHLDRLSRSALTLGLESPDPDRVRKAVNDLLAASGLSRGRLRITLSSGAGELNSARGCGPSSLIVAAEEFEGWPPDVSVLTAPWVRNDRGALVGVKSVSYAENVRALMWAREAGAGEAIFANTRGDLCEGTGTNVFVVHEGKLLTPPLTSGCLAGITRGLLLEITEAKETSLPLSALHDAEEAFLSSATRGVHPVRSVDGADLPSCPGPITEAAKRSLKALEAENLDP